MKDTLEVINRMQSEGVIGRYAIGGVDLNKVDDIVTRHSLASKWRNFQKRYVDE